MGKVINILLKMIGIVFLIPISFLLSPFIQLFIKEENNGDDE